MYGGYYIIYRLFIIILFFPLTVYAGYQKSYVLANNQVIAADHDQTVFYYATDHKRSTLSVAKANAQLENNYSNYGALKINRINDRQISDALDQQNTLGFNGERQNVHLGLQYLRARFYSSKLRVFVNEDTYQLPNRYYYVGGNPIMHIDPTGHDSMSTNDAMAIANGIYSFLNIAVAHAVSRMQATSPFTKKYLSGVKVFSGLAFVFSIVSIPMPNYKAQIPIFTAMMTVIFVSQIGTAMSYILEKDMGSKKTYVRPPYDEDDKRLKRYYEVIRNRKRNNPGNSPSSLVQRGDAHYGGASVDIDTIALNDDRKSDDITEILGQHNNKIFEPRINEHAEESKSTGRGLLKEEVYLYF